MNPLETDDRQAENRARATSAARDTWSKMEGKIEMREQDAGKFKRSVENWSTLQMAKQRKKRPRVACRGLR